MACHVGGWVLPRYVVVPGGTLDTQLVLRYHFDSEPGMHIQVYSGSDEVHLRAAWDISWVLGGMGTRRYCACFHLEKFFTKNIPHRNFLAMGYLYLGFLRAGRALHLATAVHCLESLAMILSLWRYTIYTLFIHVLPVDRGLCLLGSLLLMSPQSWQARASWRGRQRFWHL